jgi:hypothetical protein
LTIIGGALNLTMPSQQQLKFEHFGTMSVSSIDIGSEYFNASAGGRNRGQGDGKWKPDGGDLIICGATIFTFVGD